MTNWPCWIRERVREFVTACTGGPFAQMQQQASRLLEQLPPEMPGLPPGAGRAPARVRPAPAARPGRIDKSALSALPYGVKPGPTQRDRRLERNDRVNALRWTVLGRAAGKCEFRCPVPGEPTDAHHVLGGSDRRALESEYTLAAICEDCHGRCNASPAWARMQGLAWARRMEAAARAAIAAGDLSATTAAAAAGFASTAELLEARVALAKAQEGPAHA